MAFTVISNPALPGPQGFSPGEFRKLDLLYCEAASRKLLTHRSVDCDFDSGVLSYSYAKSQMHEPILSVVIRRFSQTSTQYELYQEGKGRVLRTGLFERIYERLAEEIRRIEEMS